MKLIIGKRFDGEVNQQQKTDKITSSSLLAFLCFHDGFFNIVSSSTECTRLILKEDPYIIIQFISHNRNGLYSIIVNKINCVHYTITVRDKRVH